MPPSWAGQCEQGCRQAAAAGSTGAEAVGGQAQPGLFYCRLFLAKIASDTSTPRGTSCRYPARGRGAGARRRGTAQLLGLAWDGEGAQGTGERGAGEGSPPAAGRNRASTPQSLSSILPAHWTSSPLHFQPGKKAGSRSSSQGMGTLHGASSATARHSQPRAPPAPAQPVFLTFTPPAFSGNPKK